jgi:uncharacterized protein
MKKIIHLLMLNLGLASVLWAGETLPQGVSLLSSFNLDQVRLLDGPFKHAQEMDRQYLLALDPDRFLHNFRINASFPSAAEPLGNWESPSSELRGHAAGHYLSAFSLMFASTGDKELKRRIDYMVAELAKCQAASPKQSFHSSYLAAFPESFFDRVDAGQRIWAPWYTVHKIMAGLLDAYENGHNAQALAVLEKLAVWVKFRVDRLSVAKFQASLNAEHGGMNEVLANLFAVTHNPDHLRLAQAFNHKITFDPLARGGDRLDGLHGNTQIPKIIGAAREYELTGDETYRNVAEFFWQRVALHRSFIFGGNTDTEHFFPVNDEPEHLAQTTGETCNTYNMLKLTRHIFAWKPSAESMDFYERGLYNHILASQHPETGMMIYFMSLEPGFHKLYNTFDQTFWCCTGTGMENHAKYGDTIFFHDDRSLYVNLFIASELQWKAKDLTVRQETSFPEKDYTTLVIHTKKPQKLAIKIRYPGWSDSLDVTVKNIEQPISDLPSSYVTLDREWHDGDRICVRFSMRLRADPLPGDPSLVAFTYGPLVLAGNLGKGAGQYNKPMEVAGAFPQPRIPEQTPLVPGLVTTTGDLLNHVRRAPDKPLTFVTAGIGHPEDVVLVPLYRIVEERYNVYWKLYDELGWEKFYTEAGPKEAKRESSQSRVLDEVWACWPESEKAHKLQSEQSRALGLNNYVFREAMHGGFSWTLKMAKDEPMTLRVGYVGIESPTFDIFVAGKKIAEERITRPLDRRKSSAVIKTYEVPAAIADDKDAIEIRFAGRENSGTARVIFCELSRNK